MKQLRIAAPLVVAALFMQSASTAHQDPQPSNPGAEIALPRNTREWNHLRARADSAPEFRALSKWCESQADVYTKRQADSEAELREYYVHECCSNPVKQRPRRDELLKNQIQGHKSQAKRCRELGDLYSSKAKDMESSVLEK